MENKKPRFTPVSSEKIITNSRYKRADLEYMKSLSSAVLEKSTWSSRLVLWFVIITVSWLIYWASNASIDEITRGSGKVIPTHKVQVVQNLEGGIISEVFVQEGDEVSFNQPLLKLQDIRFSSSYEENRLKILELEAMVTRLEAEAYEKPFQSKTLENKEYQEIFEAEKSLYNSHMKQLDSSLDIIALQLEQRKSELREAVAKRNQYQKSLELIEEEISIKTPLVKRGIVPKTEFIQLKREKNDIEGSLEAVTLSIPRISSTVKEASKKFSETKLIFQNRSKKELNEVKAELSRIKESIGALGDRVNRTVVRSPVAGTIKQLFANTVGGVIKPGVDIVEIVPKEEKVLIEAKVSPADIAFLHVGQKAVIKFTAYDFSIYGGLEGKVTHISADTITDEEDNTFYMVHVKTDKNYLSFKEQKLPLKVGMVTSVDILTGKKTVLDYILKPILKAKDRALRER